MHISSPRPSRPLAMAIAFVTAVLVALSAPAAVSAGPPSAPILNADHPRAVSGSFLVILREGPGTASAAATESVVAGLRQRYQLDLRFVYTAAIKGFAVRHATARQLSRLRRDPAVSYLEQDLTVSVAGSQAAQISSAEPLCWPPPCQEESVQFDPPSWHLDRISQRMLPLDHLYQFQNTGAGMRAYLIDTGIRQSHVDLAGRVRLGYDFEGMSGNDCHGHGTHLAGVLGGTAFGVAKEVTLVGVRVFDCAGAATYSTVISGVDWVTADSRSNPGRNVAVMGFSGGFSQALNHAITGSIAADVHYSVAAGNNRADACNSSPGSTPSAVTVAASTPADARASFSNFGSCVDLYAPGSDVTGPWHVSDTATNTISGTDMAAAAVAGVLALWRQQNPSMGVPQLSSALTFYATPNVVTGNPPGTANRLLYTRMS